MKKRKIPLRKCIVCQENKDKKDLLRVVRSPEGEVTLDLTGKKNGRGAYISKDITCIETAQQKKLLSKHLKAEVPDALYEELKSHVEENAE
ncbi:hypothetical protein GCM10011391_26280 [Pullulanibacillus camelliae]|uniref:YlxR domain-containing protein n=1 Tax=Pullulanibacillus camelliae TaxID=1707096 RepID=A0A8J2YJ86_9BACL|nr:YlxR family protein [Pullulanibacillus camelliae]GGE46228.1 hypothetical protein GCM10011391_26280 [Pullulanibacillus camelliae]